MTEYPGTYFIPAGDDELSRFERDQKLSLYLADISKRLATLEGLAGNPVTVAAPIIEELTASRIAASDEDKKLVSVDLSDWIVGTSNRVTVADDGDGSVTLSLPQNIDTDADVVFDSATLDAMRLATESSDEAYTLTASDTFVMAMEDVTIPTAVITGYAGRPLAIINTSGGGWADRTACSYWAVNTGTCDAGVYTPSGAGAIALSSGTWSTGYRPTKCKLTFTGGGTITVSITDKGRVPIYSGAPTSGAELDLSWAASDGFLFDISGASGKTITGIEFLADAQTIDITTGGGQHINGGTGHKLYGQYDSMLLFGDGSEMFAAIVQNPYNLTASRLMATDANDMHASVDDLTEWIAGTANEVEVADDGDGSVTVGLPDDVTIDGLTLNDLTPSRIVAASSGQVLESIGDLTAWIAGTTNQITVTDDTDGTVTLSLPQNIHTAATPTFAAVTVNGAAVFNESGGDNDFRVESDTETHALFARGSDGAVGIKTASPTAGYALTVGDSRPIQFSDTDGSIRIKGNNGGWAFGLLAEGYSGTKYGGFGFYGSVDTLNSFWIGPSYTDTQIECLASGAVIVNQTGNATCDFRVESDLGTHQFFVDASANAVGVNTSSPSSYGKFTVQQGSDTTGGGIAVVSTGGTSLRLWVDGTGQRHIDAGGTPVIDFNAAEVCINDSGGNVDFRVESDTDPNFLTLDAGLRSGAGAMGIGCAPDGSVLLQVDGDIRLADDSFIDSPYGPTITFVDGAGDFNAARLEGTYGSLCWTGTDGTYNPNTSGSFLIFNPANGQFRAYQQTSGEDIGAYSGTAAFGKDTAVAANYGAAFGYATSVGTSGAGALVSGYNDSGTCQANGFAGVLTGFVYQASGGAPSLTTTGNACLTAAMVQTITTNSTVSVTGHACVSAIQANTEGTGAASVTISAPAVVSAIDVTDGDTVSVGGAGGGLFATHSTGGSTTTVTTSGPFLFVGDNAVLSGSGICGLFGKDVTNNVADSFRFAWSSAGGILIEDDQFTVYTPAEIGDGTNKTVFAADGVMTMEGTARVYKNEWITPGAFAVPGTKPAAAVDWGISFGYEFTDGTDDTIYATIRIPQDMDRTDAPEIKIGWASDTADPGDDSKQVVWQVEYLYRTAGEDTTAAAQETLTVTTSASTTAKGLTISTITGVDLPAAADQLMMMRIKRLGADASDTLGDDCTLLGVGLRYTADKLGVAT